VRADAIAARVVGGLASATLAASSFLLGGVACGCGDPPGDARPEGALALQVGSLQCRGRSLLVGPLFEDARTIADE
jgi:hypothetical protein